jgi:hypothetical protein
MKIEQLNIIQYQLRVNLLPVKETGLGYHINKNLVHIDKVINERNMLFKQIEDSYIFKSDDGKPKKFKLSKDGKPMIDATGALVEASESEIKEGKTQLGELTNRQSEFYKQDIKNWEDEDLEVSLHVFPKDKVDACVKEDKFDGIDISALFGTLIIDN